MSSFKLSKRVDKENEEVEGGGRLNIRWILFKLRKAVNVEVARAPTCMNIVSTFIIVLSKQGQYNIQSKRYLDQSEDKTDDEKQKEKDHSLIQVLNLIDKITIHCASTLKNKNYVSDYDEICQHCQALLAYPHAWVRLKAVGILGKILAAVNSEELDSIVKNEIESDRGFIYHETEVAFRSLVLDLCAQYTPTVSQDMAEQVRFILS